jgi:DNA ligase (NAD+)
MTEALGLSTALGDEAAYRQAVAAAAAYYGDGSTALDDDAYDRLVRRIAAYEEAHPDQVAPDSPTGKVAGGAVTGDVSHTVPMLSLDNVFSPEELSAWAAGLERRLGRPVQAWSVEPKLDGLAVAARYREGRLVQLITRGDGTAGEDVSHAIGTIVGLPDRLAEPVSVEVRGEVMMTAAQFEAANLVRVEHEGTPFSNPRSGAAGTLRAKDRPYTVELTFFGYGALGLQRDGDLARRLEESAHSEVMEFVAGLGVQTTTATGAGTTTAATLEDVQRRVEEVAGLRAGLGWASTGSSSRPTPLLTRSRPGSARARRAGRSPTSSRPSRRSRGWSRSSGTWDAPVSSRRGRSWSPSRSTAPPSRTRRCTTPRTSPAGACCSATT